MEQSTPSQAYRDEDAAIVVSDDRGRISTWDAGAARIFGWTESEVQGKRVADVIVPPAMREHHSRAMGRAAEHGLAVRTNGDSREILTDALLKDGTVVPVRIVMSEWQHPFLKTRWFGARIWRRS